MDRYDVLIVGAGPGGLAAARGAQAAGANSILLLERDRVTGGILNQCIHDGFGLVRYGARLTGPEYALRALQEAEESGIELLTGYHVIHIEAGAGSELAHTVTAIGPEGLRQIEAGAIVLATGCRERTRGAISIPGSRPAGVFTAGVVQNLVNVRNVMPGKNVVILGSGDVGMIMARRLTLEGAAVKAVVEVLPEPAGLSRNVSQCLYDFDIPIYCSHTISRIIGKKKLEAVEVSQLGEDGRPIKGTEWEIACDALILSVGLIPENEVAETAGVALDRKTNGVLTDPFLQTNVPGIFSCGNARRIMDLADFVSEQGELAGRNAVAYLDRAEMEAWDEARTSSMAKGFPAEGTVTCTMCPKGCQVKYDEVTDSYTGNNCQRGMEFAHQERTAPKRILTTTVRTSGEGQKLLPVRSQEPMARQALETTARALRSVTVTPPVACGDVIAKVPDGMGGEAGIIATADLDFCLPSAKQGI